MFIMGEKVKRVMQINFNVYSLPCDFTDSIYDLFYFFFHTLSFHLTFDIVSPPDCEVSVFDTRLITHSPVANTYFFISRNAPSW